MRDRPTTVHVPTLLGGVALLLLGLLLGLARLDIIAFSSIAPWWPLLLIAAGVARIVDYRRRSAETLPAGTDRRGWAKSGGLLIVIGCWQLVNTLGLGGFTWGDSWPLLLIGLALVRIVAPGPEEDRGGGLTLLAVGGWLLLNTRHFFGLDWAHSWPLLLVLLGLCIIVRALLRVMPVPASGRPS